MLDLGISTWLEIGLALSGVAILFFAGRALMTDHAWGEGAEYEMLDLDVPREERDGSPSRLSAVSEKERPTNVEGRRGGWLGIEDRIVRIGIGIGSGFLAFTWFGKGSPAMVTMVIVAAYALVTCMAGRDPVYKKMGWSTRFQ